MRTDASCYVFYYNFTIQKGNAIKSLREHVLNAVPVIAHSGLIVQDEE